MIYKLSSKSSAWQYPWSHGLGDLWSAQEQCSSWTKQNDSPFDLAELVVASDLNPSTSEMAAANCEIQQWHPFHPPNVSKRESYQCLLRTLWCRCDLDPMVVKKLCRLHRAIGRQNATPLAACQGWQTSSDFCWYKFRLMDRKSCLPGNKRMPLFVLLYLMITLTVFLTDHLEAGLLERQATSCSAQLAGDNLAV